MPLSEHEQHELSSLARALERDDPRLCRKFARLSDPLRSQTVLGVLCMAMIAFGLGVVGVATSVGSAAAAAFGVGFAVCAPIFLSFWWNTA